MRMASRGRSRIVTACSTCWSGSPMFTRPGKRCPGAWATRRPRLSTRCCGAIVGIELPIDRLEGKLKASQDEAMQDRLGTVRGLQAESSAEARSMADLVLKAIEAEAVGRS